MIIYEGLVCLFQNRFFDLLLSLFHVCFTFVPFLYHFRSDIALILATGRGQRPLLVAIAIGHSQVSWLALMVAMASRHWKHVLKIKAISRLAVVSLVKLVLKMLFVCDQRS